MSKANWIEFAIVMAVVVLVGLHRSCEGKGVSDTVPVVSE